jgi:hypothetical protein
VDTEFYYKKGAGAFTLEDHERLRDTLASIKGKFCSPTRTIR